MDWPMCRQVERQAKRMHEMMRKLDVDIVKLARLQSGDAYARARMNCLRCRHTRECLLWLDADPPSCAAPDFCPNFALFEQCKVPDHATCDTARSAEGVGQRPAVPSKSDEESRPDALPPTE